MAKNPEVVFFLNGNIDVGYGHVARCINLSKTLERLDHRVRFIVPSNFTFQERLSEKQVKYDTISSFENETEVYSTINCSKPTICIIDCIEEEYNQLSYLANLPNTFVVTLTLFLFNPQTRYENLSFYPEFAKDTVIELVNKNKNIFRLYRGKSYFIFREEFKTETCVTKEHGKNILITMGGSDPYNLTLKVLKSIPDFSNMNITVILNGKSITYSEVEKICKKNNLALFDYVRNISSFMKSSDIIILNGGTTRYEACLTQTPFIAISIHKKQYNISQALTDEVKAINLGVGKELSHVQINDAIKALLHDYVRRKDISERMKSILDTKGGERISELIIKEYKSIYETN